jgi:hypothetical protein
MFRINSLEFILRASLRIFLETLKDFDIFCFSTLVLGIFYYV